MSPVNTQTGLRYRFRALAILAVLVGACNDADDLTSNSGPEAALDSVATGSTADSLTADSLVLDSLAVDSLSQLTPSALLTETAMFARRGLAYGPEGLWTGYTELRSRVVPFSASSNFVDAYGIIKHINAARSAGHRTVLNMTGGSARRYTTNGRFDFSKWKSVMNTYNRRDIKAAVAKGVYDGTIIMNVVMDEPNTKRWGGVMTKPLLDQMARYVKAIFPTLTQGVILRTDWRMGERFRIMDAYVAQYSWHRGTAKAFRDHALGQARNQGMKVMFSLNVIDGGILKWGSWGCPLTTTGGRGSYFPACRMTGPQVRDWGRILGTAGCGLLMWKYDNAFMSKSSNIRAMKELGSTLGSIPGRSCRRG